MNLLLSFLRAFKGLIGILKTENDEFIQTEEGQYIQFDEVTDE